MTSNVMKTQQPTKETIDIQLDLTKITNAIENQKTERQVSIEYPIIVNTMKDDWDYLAITTSSITAICAIIPIFIMLLSRIRKYWIKILKAQICYTHINDKGNPDKLGLQLDLENKKDFPMGVKSVHIAFFTKKKEIALSLQFKTSKALKPHQTISLLLTPVFPKQFDIALDNHFCLLENNPNLFDKTLGNKKIKYSKIELKTDIDVFVHKLSSKDTQVSIQKLLGYNKR